MRQHDGGRRLLVGTGAVTVGLVIAAFVVSAAGRGADSGALKDLMPRGILIGAAVNGRQMSGGDVVSTDIVKRQFSTISPENVLKPGPIHPAADRFNFEPADQFVAFAREHGLAAIGHCLVWHQQTAPWMFAGEGGARPTRDQMLTRLRTHIETVVGRYKGRIHGWDVVNEALDEDGSLRKTQWLELVGEDFIAKAFEYAHAADPDAELYYNDYNLWKPAKREAAIRLVKKLKAQGLRVDGIGEQAHWGVDEPPLADIDATVAALATSGAKVLLTEMDIDVLPRDPDMWGADLSKKATIRAKTNIYPDGLPEEAQRRLAQRYADIFSIVLKHRQAVGRVTFWGVTDAHSWLHNFPIPGRTNYPLLWDRQGQPKRAFDAVVEVLKARR
jgi:endo-1,4-beta-xylanase